MRRSVLSIGRRRLPLISLNTLVVGSGAAALNAAGSLHALGQPDVAVATEGFGRGTTFNTGSDKQTYYKIGLAALEAGDSPLQMARDLFAGGCMHGDIALAEAAGSARASTPPSCPSSASTTMPLAWARSVTRFVISMFFLNSSCEASIITEL